jgi:ribonucleoside-diphosphate reductase alpha chain
MMNKGKKLASDMKFYLDYSKYDKVNQRAETWDDSVTRVMNMHRSNPKFTQAFQNLRFVELFEKAEQAYKDKKFLGSQRALQFGGEPILKHNAKLYNCTGSYADRPRFFQEALYLLLCGCGVGFSVQTHHIDKLPDIAMKRWRCSG